MTATEASKTSSEPPLPVQEQTSQTRPISWTALLALLLGLSSPLVLLSACFLLFPLGAVLLGAVALWQTHEVEPVPLGRGAAWMGLFLGLFVASGAVAYQAAMTTLEETQVDVLFQQFLGYLRQGKLARAHQLTRNPLFRLESPDHIEPKYASDPELTRSLEELKKDLVVTFLVSARKIEVTEALTFVDLVQENRKLLRRQYTLRVVTEAGERKEVTLDVVFLRRADTRGVGAWWIQKFHIPVDQLF